MAQSDPSAQALRFRSYRQFALSRLFATMAIQMQSVGIGWHVYAMTNNPISLGFVGLAQFVPMMVLTLPAGDLADRFNRQAILTASYVVQAASSAVLFVAVLGRVQASWPFYAAMVIFGCARAFAGPAGASLVPRLVPPSALTNATTISSSIFQGSIIIGPALGGMLYLQGPNVLYSACCASFLLSAITTLRLRVEGSTSQPQSDQTAWQRVLAGIGFVRRAPIVLGAISLDLFAVLLGGATALLPIYASDILHVGPTGLGLLRSAPAIGAAAVGVLLARYPFARNAGPLMFGCVAIFGAATIVFGVSQNLTLSLIALIILGAADMVSVIVRLSLIQLATPDAMRGRVNALNQLFIGASNELGEFESGFTAALFGTVPAVILGGAGTIAVVLLWMMLFPSLRRLDRLTDVRPQDP